MIDPYKVTNFERTDFELQEFAIFCVLVAGKKSEVAARFTDTLCEPAEEAGVLPLDYLKKEGVRKAVEDCGCGQYSRISRALSGLGDLDLGSCSLSDLMNVHGIGPKTGRFFLLHTRRNAKVAVIDTHALKYLRDRGVEAPDVTPPEGHRYLRLEREFLRLVEEDFPDVPLAKADLEIWARYREKR